jgi:ribosome-binding protein aMBF1 (putative translation factor)
MQKPITLGRTHEQVVAEHMRDPAYRRVWLEKRITHHIAKVVILARSRNGWSQGYLAREIGTTQSVISRLETGEHYPSVETLRRLANVLKVTFTIDPDPHN